MVPSQSLILESLKLKSDRKASYEAYCPFLFARTVWVILVTNILTGFLTALFMKYGHSWPFLANIEFLAEIGHKASNHPTWFTSGVMITVLGALSVLEFVADKSPEARELMDHFSVWAETCLSELTTLGVMNTADADLAGSIL